MEDHSNMEGEEMLSMASPEVMKVAMALIRSYEPISCKCCDKICIFRSRANGDFFCTPGCSEGSARRVETGVVRNEGVISAATGAQQNLVASGAPRTLRENTEAAPISAATASVVQKEEVVENMQAKELEKAVERDAALKREEKIINKLNCEYIFPKTQRAHAEPGLAENEKRFKPQTLVTDDTTDSETTLKKRSAGAPASAMINRKPAQQRPEVTKADENPFLKNFPAAKESPRLNVGSPVTISASIDVLDVYNIQKETAVVEKPITPPLERPATPLEPLERSVTPLEKPMAMVAPHVEVYMWKSLKFSPELKEGAEVLIIFPWTISKYHVCAPVDEPKISDLQETINAYVKSGVAPIERTPVLNEILLAPYGDPNGEYYRARLVIVNDDGEVALAYFIDMGDEIAVSCKDLYDPTPEMMQIPILGLTVHLFGCKQYKKTKLPMALRDICAEHMKLELFSSLETNDEMYVYEANLYVAAGKSFNKIITDLINQKDSDKAAARAASEAAEALAQN